MPTNVSLTYDDGPGPHTEALLDVLRRRAVCATFFLLGQNIKLYPKAVERMVAEGHVLGNHTYSHPAKTYFGAAPFIKDLQSTDELILEAIRSQGGSQRTIPVRLPFGPLPDDPRHGLLIGLGRSHCHWTSLFQDWAERTPEMIAEDMRRHIEEFGRLGLNVVIGLHDGAPLYESHAGRVETVHATRLLLEYELDVRYVNPFANTSSPDTSPGTS